MRDTTSEEPAADVTGVAGIPASFTLAGVRFGLLTMLPLTPGSFAYGLVFWGAGRQCWPVTHPTP